MDTEKQQKILLLMWMKMIENKWKIEVTKDSILPSSSIYSITFEDGSSNISTKGDQSLTVQYEGREGVKLEIIPIGEYDENTKKNCCR